MSTIEKFQVLLRERAQEFPNESYDARFRAVTHSEKGADLLARMHRSESDDDIFSNQLAGGVPVMNPRSAALVGLRYGRDSQDEFARRWREFQRTGVKPESDSAGPSSASKPGPYSSPHSDVPLETLSTWEARSKFLDEIRRLMALGRSYDAAWQEAASTAPGKYHYMNWQAGAEAEKASQISRVKRQEFK